jgi:predicted kinase
VSFYSFINENKTIINESINDRGLFKAVFLAGQPGSGKTYVMTKITSGQIEPRIVNVDNITEFLNIHNPLSVYDKSKKISKNQLYNYLNGMLPLFVDSTSANPTTLKKRLNVLESLGYDCALIYVNTSLEKSVERVGNRKRKVGQETIQGNYSELQTLKNEYKKYFPFHMEINNNEGALTDDVILKAYKRISYFFDSEIDNPIGNERYEMMLKNGYKYIVPDIISQNDLKSMINTWYSS